ncbi:hypothetical protein M2459_003166 [Parabacteroides sp. PF5-5]|uniref:RagB/SusD family nutrient uptake outer membrane protein n=1 Tax=unclassified Parabacteroides TaxID=2649774 RepID=UPI002475AD73|nr:MULTISPECIES: RagB/SusD family nutrient uptake outer membrane protein [unclassified Parabacteroides]MDH6306442.1 hypothetical protein [Parabacteroides sp. PH5-39]MDH6317406.1 hypothetical protein [Parabacteroides sp. PF5-13]MDH6321153.1 hypothetical protein [Parabacteroides sp. PH5-13]MDH6324885.1 hypothetical protein [Parabacteroides sp. PH5-8]MDH6328591.1 hypothetical protein [Parabacteroides sp. PH5-41]
MKTINKYITAILSLFLLLPACTGDFEEMNTNPFGVTDQELTQDNNIIGMHFPSMQKSIYYNPSGFGWDFQLYQNLSADIWSGYMASPTNFKNGINNQTYFLNNDWNDACWSYTYSSVMVNQLKVKEKCQELGYETYAHFDAINSIIRVLTMSRICDQYGPIIYTRYGETMTGGVYNSAEDVYKAFFSELTEAVGILEGFLGKPSASFAKFDLCYGGKLDKWMRLANSLRLRLAMRVVKYDAIWAKKEAEAAIKAPQGVMKKDDSYIVNGYGWRHPLYTCSISYNDIFISANVQSILGGYADPRLPLYGLAKTSDGVIGVRTGLPDLSVLQDSYKEIISQINVTQEQPGVIFTAAESYFLLAEAALRGWDAGGNARQFYEEGVSASFSQWGASMGDYLNSANKPADWVDPLREDFNSPAVSKVSPNWDDAKTDEERLEKIITQKWIAGFPEGMNAWAEWRRTGYPKLFPVVWNASQNEEISTEWGVRRLTYTNREKSDNPEGYAKAVEMLKGPDSGATRLFWDINKPNL